MVHACTFIALLIRIVPSHLYVHCSCLKQYLVPTHLQSELCFRLRFKTKKSADFFFTPIWEVITIFSNKKHIQVEKQNKIATANKKNTHTHIYIYITFSLLIICTSITRWAWERGVTEHTQKGKKNSFQLKKSTTSINSTNEIQSIVLVDDSLDILCHFFRASFSKRKQKRVRERERERERLRKNKKIEIRQKKNEKERNWGLSAITRSDYFNQVSVLNLKSASYC